MSFRIGVAECSLRLPYARSLKDRRQVVRSILDGAKNRLGFSSADLSPDGLWHDAILGFAAVGSSPSEVEERLMNLENYLLRKEERGDFDIVRFTGEVFAYGDLQDRPSE